MLNFSFLLWRVLLGIVGSFKVDVRFFSLGKKMSGDSTLYLLTMLLCVLNDLIDSAFLEFDSGVAITLRKSCLF